MVIGKAIPQSVRTASPKILISLFNTAEEIKIQKNQVIHFNSQVTNYW